MTSDVHPLPKCPSVDALAGRVDCGLAYPSIFMSP